MYWWHIYLAAWLVAALGAAVLTGLFRAWAPRLGFLDRPHAEAHKSHGHAIPVLGGPAMFLAWTGTIGGALLVVWLGRASWPPRVTEYLPGIARSLPQLLSIGGGAFACLALGICDDRKPLRALPKFLCQAAICGGVAYSGVRITLFNQDPFVTWVLTTLWLGFIINALNFLDNMDGLAAGIAALAAFFFALIAAWRGQYFVTVFGAVTCGTACGFLVFNRPPASIFMGDGGSHFLGLCLGVLGAVTTYYVPAQTPTLAVLLIPILVLAVPIFDLFAVVIIRTRLGRPFYVGDNRHISHRFERMGLSRPRAVLLVLLLGFATGAGAVTLLWLPPAGAVLALLQIAAVLAVISLLHVYTLGDTKP